MFDSIAMFRVALLEMQLLETIRHHGADTAPMVTRSITITTRSVDSLVQTSSSLRSEFSADTTKTTRRTPLMAESKKSGVAWLCPLCILVLVIFFLIFVFWVLYVKKK